MKTVSDFDRRIINALQDGFPVCDRPFAAMAATMGIGESALISHLERLLADGILTRFGPLFQIERLGGAFCLAAIAAPEERYEEIAGQVNAFPEVAHNYRREHALNMWFVLATETAGGIDKAATAIEAAIGLPIFRFPKEREYFVEMKLPA